MTRSAFILSSLGLLLAMPAVSTVAGLPTAQAARVAAPDEVDFNRDVRPILSNHCFACHGPDGRAREAGLRLDDRGSAIGTLESDAVAIVPGQPQASELWRRVSSGDPDERMPPDGDPLTEQQQQILRAWIEQGAEYQQHWSFAPVTRPAVPAVQRVDWPRSEIDHFILHRLEQEQKAPQPEAAREILIRRVAFALTGLPPTLDEIDAFLEDDGPGAWDRMVDRYIDSTAYGEHMARHWLDLARYADSNGYQYDTERQQWVWRDWVIDAYNRNKPFSEFTIEQLAGDLVPEATPQQRLATGFNRNHGVTIEGGVIDEEYRTEYVMDRVVTAGTVWLGLTVGCARCHDHKFDPLSQRDFYGLYAFFNNVPEKGLNGFNPREQIASPLAVFAQQGLSAELADLRAQLDRPQPPVDRAVLEQWARTVASAETGWRILAPETMTSSGGSQLKVLDDQSIVAGGANPRKDTYEITARTTARNLTAVRLEALTHESLPGGGPGRHSNSNFVLSEFECRAVSVADPRNVQDVRFVKAMADYSQRGYEVANAIDGSVAGNNGWAVDGPTRKEPARAVFVAAAPFGFEGGTELRFRLRHEAGFATHGIGRPRLSVTTDSTDALRIDGVPHEIRQIAAIPPKERSTAQTARLAEAWDSFVGGRRTRLQAQIKELETRLKAEIPATMIMQELAQPRPTYVLERGDYRERGEPITAGTPAVFPTMPDGSPGNRLGLAQWLVDPTHPLTARVAVNRYWQRLFGIGLVKTSEDFGTQGERPSHPELLDWLAAEFVESGWDIKHLQKLMVSSAAFRQSSRASRDEWAADPENRLVARGPRVRLDAEEIRDAALAVSGLLTRRTGGPSVYPYQPPGLWMELNNRKGYSRKYEPGRGADLYRRSLYTFWKRTVPSPMLKTFDAPAREFCTVRRSRTNTPLQALLLLHGPQFVEAARVFGARIAQQGGESPEQRATWAFRTVIGRRPEAHERQLLAETYETERAAFQSDPAAAKRLLAVGESTPASGLDPVEHAAWTVVARLLLNLDEFITRG